MCMMSKRAVEVFLKGIEAPEEITERLPFVIDFVVHADNNCSLEVVEDIEKWVNKGGTVEEMPFWIWEFTPLVQKIVGRPELYGKFLLEVGKKMHQIHPNEKRRAKIREEKSKEEVDYCEEYGFSLEQEKLERAMFREFSKRRRIENLLKEKQ